MIRNKPNFRAIKMEDNVYRVLAPVANIYGKYEGQPREPYYIVKHDARVKGEPYTNELYTLYPCIGAKVIAHILKDIEDAISRGEDLYNYNKENNLPVNIEFSPNDRSTLVASYATTDDILDARLLYLYSEVYQIPTMYTDRMIPEAVFPYYNICGNKVYLVAIQINDSDALRECDRIFRSNSPYIKRVYRKGTLSDILKAQKDNPELEIDGVSIVTTGYTAEKFDIKDLRIISFK